MNDFIINFKITNDILYLNNYKNVRYSNCTNKKYLFPISLHSEDKDYFTRNRDIGFTDIPDIVEDVKKNLARIVILLPYEGYCGSVNSESAEDFQILDSWCIKFNLRKDHIYFIHGNQLPQDLNFTYIPVNSFYTWLKTSISTVISYEPVDNQNLFLLYSRRSDGHRTTLVNSLLMNNLLNRGLISYIPAKNDIIKEPLTLDIPDLENVKFVNDIVFEHFSHTFISLVTETLWRAGTVFFTEKTWKPIVAGHPFIILGSPGMLTELKKQGYKTFGEFWDEEYDNELDLEKRVKMITNELLNLSKLSINELKGLRQAMYPILQHNQELFLQRRNSIYKRGTEEPLYIEIKKIWNSF